MRINSVTIDTKICKACWKCVLACKKNVLGRINLPFHHHVRINKPDNCIGCYKCESVCKHGAIKKASNG